MFDGIKMNCFLDNKEIWLNNPLLQFHADINKTTGEVSKEQHAKYKGLIFKIIPSKEYPNIYHYEVTGSLHVFKNNGLHNADDFTYKQLIAVLNELERKFNINPQTAILHGLEIGFNLEILIEVLKFLKSIISISNKRFAEFNTKRIDLGKIIERFDYLIKIYHKSLQTEKQALKEALKDKNIIRVEIKYRKMRTLNEMGIKYLSDLLIIDKIKPLTNKLLKIINDLIICEFEDKEIDKLSLKNQLFMWKHISPRFWENLSSQQRRRERIKYDNFIEKFGKNTYKKLVLDAFMEKVNAFFDTDNKGINAGKRKNMSFLHQGKNDQNRLPLTPDFSGIFAPLECRVHLCHTKVCILSTKKESPKRVCEVCGNDISHKRATAKYCNTKCKNKANNKKRITRKKQQRIKEQSEVKQIVEKLSYSNFMVKLVFTKLKEESYKNIRSSKIRHFQYKDFLRITKVSFTLNGKKHEFNRASAKELIKVLMYINNQSYNLKKAG